MTIILDWPVALVIAAAFVAVAAITAWGPTAQQQGGMDMVPGSGIGQAPDAEEVEARVGFRA